MMEWLKALLRPANPKAAAALAEYNREASWWTMHRMISPLGPMSPEAEEIRQAFLAPFLAMVASFNSYADGTTRQQTRTFWEVVRCQQEDFWLAIPRDEAKTWPQGSWNTVRNVLFGLHNERDDNEHDLRENTGSDTNNKKRFPLNGHPKAPTIA